MLLLPLVLSLLSLNTAAQDKRQPSTVYGVPPNATASYLKDFPNFSCQDSSTTTQQLLPFTSVNDNYCDCKDGSDEPGTSACSYLNTISFYCPNHSYKSKMIPTAWLRDGICDCCDGSDEINTSILCPNTCSDLATEALSAASTALERIKTGYKVRTSLVHSFKKQQAEKLVYSKEIMSRLGKLKGLQLQVATLLKKPERQERLMQIEAFKNPSMEFDSRTTTSTISTTEQTCSAENTCQEEKVGTGLEAILHHRYVVHTSPAKGFPETPTLAQYIENLQVEELNTQVSNEELRKGGLLGPFINNGQEGVTDFIELVLQAVGMVFVAPIRLVVSLVPIPIPGVSLPERYWVSLRTFWNGNLWKGYRTVEWVWSVMWEAPLVLYQYFSPSLDQTVVLNEAQSLRKILEEITNEIESVEKEKEDEAAAAAAQTKKGDKHHHHSSILTSVLENQCIEKKVEKYNYKLCFFKTIHQDHTLIGKYSSKGERLQVYDKGQKCYNGPLRSGTVSLSCGASNEIKSVEESSPCAYEINVETPMVCDDILLKSATQELQQWKSVKAAPSI